MSLPIVEKARERLAGRPLATLLDETVIERFGLLPAEQKTLCGLLLADGNILEASTLAGTSEAAFKAALDNLVARGLAKINKGEVDLRPMAAQLRVEDTNEAERDAEGIPQPKIVFRSVLEQAVALAASDNNPSVGLGRAYAFVFGRKPTNFPMLGLIAKELGARRAAQFFMEHALDSFTGDPLAELLPQARWLGATIRNNGVRPDTAPDEAARKAELSAEAERAWTERMQRYGTDATETEVLMDIDELERHNKLDSYQAAMARRQAQLDFVYLREKRKGSL